MAKEKIEKICQIVSKIEGIASYWRNYWQKAGEFNHLLFVTLFMQRYLICMEDPSPDRENHNESKSP